MFNNRDIWNSTYPIMVGNLAQKIITLTDTAFMGRISDVALGASAMAAIYYYVFSTLAWGFAIGVQVIVARRFGEQNFDRVGTVFQHGLAFVTLLGVALFSLLYLLSPLILRGLITSDNVYGAAMEFISVRSYGIFFVCFNYLFRSFYVGLSSTKVISYTTILMAVVNISLDYCLIFGKMSLPAMGIKGAALASVIAEASAMVFFIFFTLKTIDLHRFGLSVVHKFEFKLLFSTLRIAIPSMAQKLISFGTWLIFFSFVERMGEVVLASAMTIRSVYMMVGIPVFAYATTANTLISRSIGNGDKNVLPICFKVIKLCVVTILPIVALFLLMPRTILSIYSDNPQLVELTVNSLYVTVLVCLCHCVGIVLFEAVSGTGNTDHALYFEIFVLLVYVAFTWLTASHLKLSIEYVWMSELVYGVLLGVLSYLYLRYFHWQKRKIV